MPKHFCNLGRKGASMDDRRERLRALLHEAAETHHVVYRITDGTDDDWATWYSRWLLTLSELPDILGRAPARSHLTHELVGLDREYTRTQPGEPWEEFYARALVERFGAP